MTRVLVMQLFEALIHAVPSDQEDEQAEAIAAITEAREYLATETSGELAQSVARLAKQWAELDPADPYRADVGQAVDMLEADADLRTQLARRTVERDMAISMAISMLVADAQQANKPTGWDNGLSQDYCAEFGQWLASRPGARQQIKEMFDEPEEEDLYALALKADNWGQP